MMSPLFIVHWFVASVPSSFMAVSDSDVRSSWGFHCAVFASFFPFSIALFVVFSVASSGLWVSSFFLPVASCRLNFFFFFRLLGLFPVASVVAYWVAY